MGANAPLALSERVEVARPGDAARPSPRVTCVVIGDGGLRVVAMSDAPAPHPGAAGEPDLSQLAEILERAARSLREELPVTVHTAAVQPLVHRRGASPPEPLRIGQLEVYAENRLVMRAGQPVPLSRIEFDLFLALVRRAGTPATRLELVREVWGYGAAVTSRSVDTQVYNLRHKLEENPATPRHLLTVSGIGYRVAP